jgi:hypothetical protein
MPEGLSVPPDPVRPQDRDLRRLDAAEWTLLERLRDLAPAALRSGRLDPWRACTLIAPEPGAAVAVYGTALLRALDGAVLCALPFHRRGTPAVAFGEAWVLRLVGCLAAQDEASARFLVGRAVRPHDRRAVLWLAARLAEAVAGLRPEGTGAHGTGIRAALR